MHCEMKLVSADCSRGDGGGGVEEEVAVMPVVSRQHEWGTYG